LFGTMSHALVLFSVAASVHAHGFIETPASRQSVVCNATFPDSRLPALQVDDYFFCISDLETGADMPDSGLPTPILPDNVAGRHPGVAKMGEPLCAPPVAHGRIDAATLTKLGSPGPVQATWTQGQRVDITWNVQANHGGWYSYRLCPDGSDTEECFSKHVLKNVHGEEWMKIDYADCCWYTKMVDTMIIPDDISCERCTLHWRWDAGEEDVPLSLRESSVFTSCSDVRIVAKSIDI